MDALEGAINSLSTSEFVAQSDNCSVLPVNSGNRVSTCRIHFSEEAA